MSKLPEYLSPWGERDGSLPRDKKFAIIQQTIPNLREARSLVLFLCSHPERPFRPFYSFPPVTPKVALSLALLGVTLTHATGVVLGGFEDRARMVDIDEFFPQPWSGGNILLDHMESQGWCPYLLAGASNMSLDAKYYAATFGPPCITRNRRRCSDAQCLAVQYKEELYRTKHASQRCTCTHLGPALIEMNSIINEEGIPLVRWCGSSAVKDRGRLDGLGNPHMNTLPQCQLSVLQETVNSLYWNGTQLPGSCLEDPSVTFWIDTLCVPVGKILKNLRSASIKKMKDVYESADKVLVIYSEVSSCSVTCDQMEFHFRVHLSNWTRRLWTLQEGFFANFLHFLVADGTISLSKILREEAPGRLEHGMRKKLAFLIGDSPNQIMYLWRVRQDFNSHPNEATVEYMIRAIATHTTTRKEDEPISLATLLNIPLDPILNHTDSARLSTLFEFLPGIPPSIMFLPGPREDRNGFKWMPQSLSDGSRHIHLNSPPTWVPVNYHSTEMRQRPTGTRGPQGLTAMYPGLQLEKINPNHAVKKHYLVDTSSSAGSLGVELNLSGKRPVLWKVLYKPDNNTAGDWE